MTDAKNTREPDPAIDNRLQGHGHERRSKNNLRLNMPNEVEAH